MCVCSWRCSRECVCLYQLRPVVLVKVAFGCPRVRVSVFVYLFLCQHPCLWNSSSALVRYFFSVCVGMCVCVFVRMYVCLREYRGNGVVDVLLVRVTVHLCFEDVCVCVWGGGGGGVCVVSPFVSLSQSLSLSLVLSLSLPLSLSQSLSLSLFLFASQPTFVCVCVLNRRIREE